MTNETFFITDTENPYQLDNLNPWEGFDSLDLAVKEVHKKGGPCFLWARWGSADRDYGYYSIKSSRVLDLTIEEIAVMFATAREDRGF